MEKLLIAHLRSGDDLLLIDVLQTKDGLWLVPEWLESKVDKRQTPARAIRLDRLQHQMVAIDGADLVVNQDIPRDVLEGRSTSAGGLHYEVVDGATHFGWLPLRQTS
ncbi:hypothetical protein [Lysobacter solisilvae (ex Woo and Kim 2020)]|uniref:Uncharacterized protein n=1 Tax=Agrilutibacter terrestris TaxID=2865112 RepID=A0A7H0FVZ4_9GAMM|nr:hypothetical protein [Lysobacter terrestris]QNP40210.1 hypothetical protein H8B22_12035 [Lysobacter terrestris]